MSDIEFENKLRSLAQGMDYPRTPDIAAKVTARLRPATRPRVSFKALAWSLTIILVLFSSLMLIPPVRAAIVEFIQIGVIRIFPPEPTVEPITTATPQSLVPTTATPAESGLIPILAQMDGRTTLVDAQSKATYSILLPEYPSDLGAPDHVYTQNMDGPMVVLVWLDPAQPKQILMSLHFIPDGSWAVKKFEPTVIEETRVNGEYAIWTTGPYPMYFSNGDLQFRRMVSGHVLIWAGEDVTYRLESDLSLEEAVRIAESLKPIQ
jgi:hypothetical protein